jgi:hypothetical protein
MGAYKKKKVERVEFEQLSSPSIADAPLDRGKRVAAEPKKKLAEVVGSNPTTRSISYCVETTILN